jgi:hypothetical protein
MPKFKGPDTRAMIEAGRSGGEFAYRGAKARLEQEQEQGARVERGISRGAEMLIREGARQDEMELRRQELDARKEKLKQSMGLEERKMSLAEAKAGYQWEQDQPPGRGKTGIEGQPETPSQQVDQTQPDAGIGQQQQQEGAQDAQMFAGGQGGGQQQPPMQGPPVAPPEDNAAMLKQDLAFKQGKGYHALRPEEKARRRQAGLKASTELSIKMRNADTAARNAETAYERALTERGDKAIKHRAEELLKMDKAATATQDVIDDVLRGKITPEGMAAAFPNNPDMERAVASGDDAEVQKVAMRLLKAKRDTAGLKYMAKSGKFWSTFDESSDMGRKVTQLLPSIRDAMEYQLPKLPGDIPGPALRTEFQEEKGRLTGTWKGLQTDTQRSQFARKTLARLLVEAQERLGRAEVQMGLMQQNQRTQQVMEENRAYRERFGALPQPGDGNVPTGSPTDPGAFTPTGQLGDIPKSWKQAR